MVGLVVECRLRHW